MKRATRHRTRCGWLALLGVLAVGGPAVQAMPAPSQPASSVPGPASAPRPAPKVVPRPAPRPAPKPAAKPPPKPAAPPTTKAPARPAATAAAPVAALATAPAASAAARPEPPRPTDPMAWCRQVSSYLVNLSAQRCQQAGLAPGDGRSVRGVPLWFRDVRPTAPAGLRVLVLGGIHGDEMASVNVVFDWLERAVKVADPGIHWRMVPLVNPDGLMRKPSTRVNARGVDLNRNFPTPEWERAAQAYWASRTGKDPRRFPGPAAMSEPETRWVQAQVDQFKPHLIVSVHAPYGVLDFDGPPPPPDKLGSLHLDQVGIYPGSLGNYGGVVRRVPVVTLELRNARQVSAIEMGAMWTDLRGWIDRRRDQMAQIHPTEPPRR